MAVLVGGVVGCGGPSYQSATSSTSTGSISSSPAGAPTPSGNQPPAAGLVFDVTIANGQVNPTNAVLQAKVGQPITVHVTSDATDELHVHSVPDKEFAVAAAPNQTFQLNVPGDVEVELHHLDRTLATIQVRP